MEPVELVQMSIYQSINYRKDLSWLHFDAEPRFQERQQKRDQQTCISVFVAYLKIPSSNYRSNSPDMKTVFNAWLYGRFIDTEQPRETETL